MNIWKSYIWTADKDANMKAIFAVMNTTWAVVKIRPKKNSGPYGTRTHDPCDTGAALYQPRQPGLFGTIIMTSSQLASWLGW